MILLIDSYDSFTNNLSRLFEKATGKQVIVLHNDALPVNQYEAFLSKYIETIEYIIIGPGPGHPQNPRDVGIISWIFKHFMEFPESAVPILGICLGFQCLCHEFGSEVKRLKDIKHGQVYNVRPLSEDEELFQGQFGSQLPSVRYHSLHVEKSDLNSNLIPLAVCDELHGDEKVEILMAAKHNSLPFYGVQYHPESVCSDAGATLVENFDSIASKYNKKRALNISSVLEDELRIKVKQKPLCSTPYAAETEVHVSTLELPALNGILPVDICDRLVEEDGKPEFILLNSASIPGQWSIVGFPEKGRSGVITHSVDSIKELRVLTYGTSDVKTIQLEDLIWHHVGEKFAEKYIPRHLIMKHMDSKKQFPFLGGYLGMISYEEGKHIVIEKLGNICNQETPDLKLVFVERFLLYDHQSDEWTLMSVNADRDDSEWVRSFTSKLNKLFGPQQQTKRSVSGITDLVNASEISFEFPSEDIYKQQFQKCQDYLRSGNSYELCLTTALKIFIPSQVKAWDIYLILVNKNPSPFSCFMDFEDVCLISSSPERFLSWKGEESKTVELRPIKGTVNNTEAMTIEKATEILKTPKEMGENLMIVDLIRHDLHQFIQQVEIPHLMTVEEYKTVYQLVSVIRGDLGDSEYHGIDILHSSLPPGSMTGAPKERSVELLQDIEEMQPTAIKGGRRGIYSGVVGYWSVTDDSDWSVIIRSLFHYADDKQNSSTHNVWRIGAGGAITVLSEVQSEWDEMHLKLSSALQALM